MAKPFPRSDQYPCNTARMMFSSTGTRTDKQHILGHLPDVDIQLLYNVEDSYRDLLHRESDFFDNIEKQILALQLAWKSVTDFREYYKMREGDPNEHLPDHESLLAFIVYTDIISKRTQYFVK